MRLSSILVKIVVFLKFLTKILFEMLVFCRFLKKIKVFLHAVLALFRRCPGACPRRAPKGSQEKQHVFFAFLVSSSAGPPSDSARVDFGADSSILSLLCGTFGLLGFPVRALPGSVQAQSLFYFNKKELPKGAMEEVARPPSARMRWRRI